MLSEPLILQVTGEGSSVTFLAKIIKGGYRNRAYVLNSEEISEEVRKSLITPIKDRFHRYKFIEKSGKSV